MVIEVTYPNLFIGVFGFYVQNIFQSFQLYYETVSKVSVL